MHFGKLLAHHVASCHPGIWQTSESVLLARSLAKQVWTEEEWEHCVMNRVEEPNRFEGPKCPSRCTVPGKQKANKSRNGKP